MNGFTSIIGDWHFRALLALTLVVCLLTLGGSAWGMEKWQGYCETGGQKVSVPGLGQSTTKWMQSYPGCTVTVYDSGTANLSTIYSDDGVTPKANPFVADSTTGLGFFYAANGLYDVQFSGGGITSPFTLSGWLLNDPSGTGIFTTLEVGLGGIIAIPNTDCGFGETAVLGCDIAIRSQGPADVVPWAQPYSQNTSTSVGSAGIATITVGSTTNYYRNLGASPTSLYIELRGAANFEALTAGTAGECASLLPPSGKWCISSPTQIVANFTKTHTAPYAVWQYGAILNRAYVLAQTAQDGTNLWFSQQDASTAPYYFHWGLGSGATFFQYTSGGRSFFADNYLDTNGTKGMLFNATQTILRTGTGASFFIQDASTAQYMKLTTTQTDLTSPKLTLGGTTSSYCMFKDVAGPVMQTRLADDSADCTLAAGVGSFNSILVNTSAATISSAGLGSFSNLRPVTAATGTVGSASLPFSSMCFGNAANNSACFTGTFTGNRVVTFPDASMTLAGIDKVQTFSSAQTFSAQITSTLTTGTAPFAVSSTTVNTSLNADLLDGFHAGNASTGHAMCWKDASHMGYCSDVVSASGTCTCN